MKPLLFIIVMLFVAVISAEMITFADGSMVYKTKLDEASGGLEDIPSLDKKDWEADFKTSKIPVKPTISYECKNMRSEGATQSVRVSVSYLFSRLEILYWDLGWDNIPGEKLIQLEVRSGVMTYIIVPDNVKEKALIHKLDKNYWDWYWSINALFMPDLTKIVLLDKNTEFTLRFTKTVRVFKFTDKERKCAEDMLKVYVTLKKKRESSGG